MRASNLAQLVAASLALLGAATACPGVDHGAPARRSDRMATQPSGGTSLLRPLRWGDVQILATTDIHGWYQGHLKRSQPEPNYSGDWGDFASFVQHMHSEAERRGVDLLLVDSGDLHDGAGLSDGFPAGQGPDGHVSNQFHSMVRFDALSVGNHELYVYANALDTFRHFRTQQHGRYLASNVNITYTPHAKSAANVTEPMGERVVKFRTKHGRRVTSLGVLFNFTGAAPGLTVQDPARMVEEQWFADAIQERPDFFLLVGHMPVRKDQWPTVLAPIRKLHPHTPVFIAGGHTHIRDTVVYDEAAVGIESGRYLETIGWLSANLTRGGDGAKAQSTSFSRSYIDANRRNYAFHAGLSEQRLDTPLGRHITTAMGRVAEDWNLTQVYGTAPQDYYLDRTSPDSPNSLLRLLSQQVLPTVISSSNPARKGVPNLVLANSGSQRFDVFSGPFMKNDQYIVSPFLDNFLFLRDVPYKYAAQLVGKLNGDATAQANSRRSAEPGASSEEARSASYARGEIDDIYNDWRQEQHERAQADLEELDRRADEQRTLGYSTKDDMGTDGDDTEHVALPYARQPDYVASPLTGNSTAAQPDTLVDVIFVDFILSSVVRLLNGMQSERIYSKADATNYTSLTTQDLYPQYARAAWQQQQQ